MARSSGRRARDAASLTAGLMLAPAVAAMRMPMLTAEAQSLNPWGVETALAVNEKTAAMMEGAVAAHISLAQSMSRFWFEVAMGKTPSMMNGVAVEHAVHAALRPSSRRVKSNYNRLTRAKK